MIQGGKSLPKADKQSIINCFLCLFNPNTTPDMRRNANQHLNDIQANPIELLTNLLLIFEESNDQGLKLQSIVCFCNVVKRNWTTRRYSKAHAEFDALKKDIRNKILQYICMKDKRYVKTLFNIVRFIVEKDFPHQFPSFSQFVQKMIGEISLDSTSVTIFKQLKEIFYEIGERKGSINKKFFEESLRGILNMFCELSMKLKDAVVAAAGENGLSSELIKLSKYSDQIILYILRVAPADLMDQPFSQQVTQFLLQKLQELLSTHNAGSKEAKALLEKNIKSLIYDFGLLQLSKPLLLCWILQDFFNILVYVLQNYTIFIKNDSVRYSLVGLRRIIKEFSYYAEDSAFMSSIKSKTTSANCLELRRICVKFYMEVITPSTVQQLLNFLLFNPFTRSCKEHSYFDLEEGSGVDRGKEKELGIEACVVLVIQGLLERFTSQTHGLVASLTFKLMQSNWTSLDKISISNLLSVIAILPSTCRKNQQHHIQNIPVLDILQFIYSDASYKIKFASIVSGWIDAFTNDQLNSLNNVLIDFIQSQGQGEVDDGKLDLLMNCSQCLNKIVTHRTAAIDLRALVQRVLPVSLSIFQNIDNPQILWPMITLISKIITKVQFQPQLIVNSIDPSKLSQLIANQAPLLVQALCEMFKGFLCVIPRGMPAQSVIQLVCLFLNNHLSQFTSVNHQKIFHLWYIAIREYSPLQGCDSQYIDLFTNHFRKNMYRKTATLVYILEEYLLSALIPDAVQNFIGLAVECYMQAEDLEKDEREKLKIATLSFQITLITKFQLEQANSDKLLHLILQDLANFDLQVITPTIRNSILSIINRYVILHQQSFFNYLLSINLTLPAFFQVYFKSMEYLTSNTATKINAVALLSLINNIDSAIIIPQLHFILRLVIPEVEKYFGTLQNNGMVTFIGKVDNSPSLRFASNILSQRKEEVRKLDVFDDIDISITYRTQVGSFLQKCNIPILDVASAFNDTAWADRFLKLL